MVGLEQGLDWHRDVSLQLEEDVMAPITQPDRAEREAAEIDSRGRAAGETELHR